MQPVPIEPPLPERGRATSYDPTFIKDLSAAADVYRACLAQMHHARDHLYRLLQRGVAAGVPRRRLAEATGLSRTRVDQVINNHQGQP